LAVKSKCSDKLWKALSRRRDKILIKYSEKNSSSSDEAILLDCVANGQFAFREYNDMEQATDYFLGKIKYINIDTIAIKVALLQCVDTNKFGILLQDLSHTNNFNQMINEIKWIKLKR
jgi:hypothetical protein